MILFSLTRSRLTYFYLYDGLGRVRALSDRGGVVSDRYSYDAYGNLLSTSGSSANNYRFTGEQFDPNTGDYYLRDRYYGTDIGRFTRSDVFEGDIRNPLSLNKYLYSHANPVEFIDPTGKSITSAFQAAVVSTIIGIISSLVYPDAFAPASLDGTSVPRSPIVERVLFSILLSILTANVGSILNSADEIAGSSLGSVTAQLDDLTSRGADFSNGLQKSSTEFQSRVVALTEDVASGSGRQVQAIGGARLEKVLGRQIQPSSNSTYDFLDAGGIGKVELKGPFLSPKTLEPITKFRSIQQITLDINSDIAHTSSGAKIIIDTLGLTDEEALYIARNITSSPGKIGFIR